MCNPFSCIVKPDLSLIVGKNLAVHSHSQMWLDAGYAAEFSVNQSAKVELQPSDNQWLSDVATWTLKLDQDRTPDWWSANLPEIDARVRDAAVRWQGQLLRLTEWTVVYGETLIVVGDAKIDMTGGEAWFYGQSTGGVDTLTGGSARFFGQSSGGVATLSGGEARFYDHSTGGVATLSGGAALFYRQSSGGVDTLSGGVALFYDRSTGGVDTMTGGGAGFYDRPEKIANDTRKINKES